MYTVYTDTLHELKVNTHLNIKCYYSSAVRTTHIE